MPAIKQRSKSEHIFQVYLRSLNQEERETLVTRCKTTYDYLRKLCGNGGRKPSPALAKTIAEEVHKLSLEINKGGDICKGHLRPDIWEVPKQSKAA